MWDNKCTRGWFAWEKQDITWCWLLLCHGLNMEKWTYTHENWNMCILIWSITPGPTHAKYRTYPSLVASDSHRPRYAAYTYIYPQTHPQTHKKKTRYIIVRLMRITTLILLCTHAPTFSFLCFGHITLFILAFTWIRAAWCGSMHACMHACACMHAYMHACALDSTSRLSDVVFLYIRQHALSLLSSVGAQPLLLKFCAISLHHLRMHEYT